MKLVICCRILLHLVQGSIEDLRKVLVADPNTGNGTAIGLEDIN
jgi:hypothetical protein